MLPRPLKPPFTLPAVVNGYHHQFSFSSVGDTLRFGVLDRFNKHVTQDIGQLNVPADLDDLLTVLVGI
ncbi:MAG: hypothetical protein H7Y38_12205 [Armatimonadetes bacterium]|nr:hypothetical protein [Armatimonadota bacterium]